ncbi:unnamed protein product [Heterobilharzia americana]|nr:unnamed protein product [Heterobilharzia americana]
MKGRCEAQHNEILRNQEHTTININNQKKMETSEQYFDSSKEHLLALNLLRSELDKWNGVEDASSLKSPYIWIPPKKISDAQSKSLNRQKKSIKKGKGNLLFMLASGPERCQSFIQQISLIKTGSNQTQICDHNVQSGMDRIPNKTTCMPRWVTSCHISGQALKSRLLPLARAQIRRRIRRGSLILYPNGNNLESERISTKRSVNDAVALTTLSDTVNKHDRFDQQNSVLPEIIVPNQNLLYLNDSLKSEKTNLKQHQHTTPHFLNELLKAHQSDRRRRSYADIQLREQDKSKVKTHRLTDLLFFEQSEQVTAKKSPHYMDSVDSTQDLCMNRCYLSPINWPSLLNNNNSEMQETGYNLNEVILSLSSQKKNCTDCVMCPKNLVDGNKSPSHRNCSVEDISNSVAIWQKCLVVYYVGAQLSMDQANKKHSKIVNFSLIHQGKLVIHLN